MRRVLKYLTCFIGEPEDDPTVRNAADVPDGGNAAVVGIVFGPQVLQLQDLCFPLQLRVRGRKQCANVCSSAVPPRMLSSMMRLSK